MSVKVIINKIIEEIINEFLEIIKVQVIPSSAILLLDINKNDLN